MSETGYRELSITRHKSTRTIKHRIVYGDEKSASTMGSFGRGETRGDRNNEGTMVRDGMSAKILGLWLADTRLSKLAGCVRYPRLKMVN